MNRRTILILVLFTAACQSENTQLLLVKGTLLHMDKMTGKYASLAGKDSITLYLDEIPFGKDYNYKRLDSQKVSVKNPKFELRGKTLSNGMFDILIGEDGPMIPIIHDASALEVTIDLSNPVNYYMIKGSAASEQLRMFINDYIKAFMLEYNATYELDSLKKTGAADSLLIEATNRKNSQIESLNGLLRNQLRKASNPYVALYIAGIMQRRFTTAEYDQLLYDLVVKFPENDELISYKKQYELFKEQQRASEKGSWIGKSAPELILPDTMGKQVALSSFKGKYVLVDFWASWCRPCRLENPNVVAAYEKYRNKNFSVLGVSLDKSKEPWMEAIHSDRLQWTHISDLAFWNSEAVKIFRFDGIPFNVLIDPNGVVIGEGLRGNALQQKLQEVLK